MRAGFDELNDIDVVFRALAHEQRRHILVVLAARGGEMTAGDIAARFACAWPTTSRHLRQLEDAGLVRVRQNGREWLYELAQDRLDGIAGKWIDWFKKKRKPSP